MTKISKPAAISVTLAMVFAAILLFASCNNHNDNPKGSVVIPVPDDTSALAKINHFIPEDQIKQYRAAFRTQNDSLRLKFPSLLLPDAEAFNKPALLQILKDPRCVGIRIYHGVKTGGNRNEVRVILVGVDSQGNDILISGGSPVAADVTDTKGGDEHGQCPTCQTTNNQ
jgi:hypothetical protein